MSITQSSDPIVRVNTLVSEGLIGMKDVAVMYASGNGGKTPSATTAARHALNGVNRNGVIVRLESIRVGSRLMTSKQAVLRFLAALNTDEPTPAPIAPAKRNREAAKAHDQLSQLLNVG